MDWSESVRQDLAVMRRLAEQGGRLTTPGGPHYISWGVLVGIGFFYTYLVSTKAIALPGWTIGVAWAAVNVAGISFSIWMGRRESRNPDSVRLTNRIVGTIWMVTGISMASFFAATLVSSYALENARGVPPWMTAFVAPFFIGAAFGSIALLCRLNWMLFPAACWWVVGVAGIVIGYTSVTTPILAAAQVILMIGTGLKLVAMERDGRG